MYLSMPISLYNRLHSANFPIQKCLAVNASVRHSYTALYNIFRLISNNQTDYKYLLTHSTKYTTFPYKNVSWNKHYRDVI